MHTHGAHRAIAISLYSKRKSRQRQPGASLSTNALLREYCQTHASHPKRTSPMKQELRTQGGYVPAGPVNSARVVQAESKSPFVMLARSSSYIVFTVQNMEEMRGDMHLHQVANPGWFPRCR